MNDKQQLADAVIKPKRGISWVWLLPIIAVIIGGVLFYDAWSNRGVDIVVQFEDAQGIEAKQTLVKFRNVEIGRVERIRFADDGQSIMCDIKINREMQRFLRTDSRFWVVRPRIGASGISGVNTLLSGAYITMQPGEDNNLTNSFIGLNSPPLASPSEAGLKLTLESTGGKSLREGNPVTYRGIDVGVVESVNFDIDQRHIKYGIFIRAPYDVLITSNTYFWNASGVSISTSVEGVQVDMASIESLVSGGVAFDVPDDLAVGEPVEASKIFKLYPSQLATYEDRYYEYLEYAILVDETVGGLVAGAPVEYRGIKIGRVAKPYLGFYETNAIRPNEERIPVIVHIEPERLTQRDDYDLDWFTDQFSIWLKTGLEARIETANYLTGSLKVSLDMSGPESSKIEEFGSYQVIPIAKGGFAGLLEKTDDLLEKLNQLPIEKLLNNANSAVNNATVTMASVETLVSTAEKTLKEASATLKTVQPNSEIHERLLENLDQLERTLLMVQPLINDIKQKPNQLIFSEPRPEDKQPGKAK